MEGSVGVHDMHIHLVLLLHHSVVFQKLLKHDGWTYLGLVDPYTKVCRSVRQHLFVFCRSAASTVCTEAVCTATGEFPLFLHCCSLYSSCD
jgi:hypothetical protein